MSSSPRQLRICTQCGKKFGKQLKLERHLLEAHGATLSIPPPTTPPSPSFLLVETQLESALAEATRCFQLGNPSCRLCVHKKPFKNSRDLAQHLVSKHTQQLMCAESVPLACPPTSSEVSAKPDARHKRPSNVAFSDPHKRVRIEHSLQIDHHPQAKRAKLSMTVASSLHNHPSVSPQTVPAKPIHATDQAPLPNPPLNAAVANRAHTPATVSTKHVPDNGHQPKANNNIASAENASAGNASAGNASAGNVSASAIKRTKSAPVVNPSAALSSNSSSRSGTPSSGCKPPITPKRSKPVMAPKHSIKNASSPAAAPAANASAAATNPTANFNPLRVVHKQTTMMDFSTVGVGANTRKSYYTLKNS
ncbi:unnamed protein product [Agarophyton chilense]